MRTKVKNIFSLLSAMLLISLTSCSEEIYERHNHNGNSKKNNIITFKQFKKETGINDFKFLKSVGLSNDNNRAIEAEFLTDSTEIIKYTSVNDKVTYSFKIYPIYEALESREYYNLVYEKFNNEWNELIFLNKEREIQQEGESILESSKMIYNEKLSAMSMSGFCEVINYTIQCDGSCDGTCDGFACPTGQCIHESVSYVYCGNSGGLEALPLTLVESPGNSGGGGGNEYSGIYIPNPYNGEADLNNPDFVFATQVAAFTRTLPNNLKNLMTNNFWIYPNIVDFMNNNDGLTQENKDAVIFALTNSIPIFNLNPSNWTLQEINRLRYETFIFLLNNPNIESLNLVSQIEGSIINNTIITAFPFFKYPLNSNYETIYPNFTMLIRDYIPNLKDKQRLIETIHNLTNVSQSDILFGLTWGNGPEINITQLGVDPNGKEYYGKFTKIEPNKIFIDIDLVLQLETLSNIENPTPQQNQQLAFLYSMVTFSVCLHEYVHYNDFAFDGSMQDNENLELGLLFEELFLGGFYDFDLNGNVVYIRAN